MQLEALARLRDVLDACETIRLFAHGKTLSDFLADKMLRQAVERNFEIIGEALNHARKLEPVVGQRVSCLQEIVDFRNLLIHGYAVVKHEVVWHTILEDLPLLEREVGTLISTATDAEAI